MIDIEGTYNYLISNGFRLINKDTSKYFSDYFDTFTNDIIRLRFSSTQSIKTIDICSIEEKENWYDLALVKALLNQEQELNVVTSVEVLFDFLVKELILINKMFNTENYPITKVNLEDLGNKRAKQMFPPSTSVHL